MKCLSDSFFFFPLFLEDCFIIRINYGVVVVVVVVVCVCVCFFFLILFMNTLKSILFDW